MKVFAHGSGRERGGYCECCGPNTLYSSEHRMTPEEVSLLTSADLRAESCWDVDKFPRLVALMEAEVDADIDRFDLYFYP